MLNQLKNSPKEFSRIYLNTSMYFVVLGPRRSGTNYLSELILRNTSADSYKIANLDNSESFINKNERIINLYNILGSKHSLTDVPIEK